MPVWIWFLTKCFYYLIEQKVLVKKEFDLYLMSTSWIQITFIEIIQEIKIFSVARLNFINYAWKDFSVNSEIFLGLFFAKFMKVNSFCGCPYSCTYLSMCCCIIYYQISSNGGRSTRKTFYFQLLGYASLYFTNKRKINVVIE